MNRSFKSAVDTMMRRLHNLAFVFVFAASVGYGQDRVAAFQMNERLGRGINMGNSFEAPTETAWGNPWSPEYFKIMADLGFKHVRLPVRWETDERSMATAPYTITPSFLDRIQEVVDAALKNKLHIIVNMHHHEALFANAVEQKQRFLSQWYQIADRFKSYPDSVLFEVMNEPHGGLTPTVWNEYFAAALTEIRKTNPTRMVLIGVADYGGLGSISQLQLPSDEYLILTAHYYNPFSFTHQGAEWVTGASAWLGTKWLDTEVDRETVLSEFNYVLNFSQTRHIPLNIGEFGAYSTADIDSRARWTNFLARWFEEKKLSWAYWEFSSSFGIYNPVNKEYNQKLVDALLHNTMAQPTAVYPIRIYSSDFSTGTGGWTLSQQSSASGSLSSTENKLKVDVTSAGTETWHLQLVKNNIRLEKGKIYRLSFTMKAAADRSITAYISRASSPWTSYSDPVTHTITAGDFTYVSAFTMAGATDPAARIVFDVGKNANDLLITSVKIDEMTFVVTGVEDKLAASVHAYPNPASSQITIEDLPRYQKAELIDVRGQLIEVFGVTPETTSLDISHVPPGFYILSLNGKPGNHNVRVIKK